MLVAIVILIFVGGTSRLKKNKKNQKKHGPKFMQGRLKFTMLNGIICELKHLHPELQLFQNLKAQCM